MQIHTENPERALELAPIINPPHSNEALRGFIPAVLQRLEDELLATFPTIEASADENPYIALHQHMLACQHHFSKHSAEASEDPTPFPFMTFRALVLVLNNLDEQRQTYEAQQDDPQLNAELNENAKKVFALIDTLCATTIDQKIDYAISDDHHIKIPGINNPHNPQLRESLQEVLKQHEALNGNQPEDAITYHCLTINSNTLSLEKVLTGGVQCAVRSATYLKTQKVVAKTADQGEDDALEKETEILKQLYHPNIIAVIATTNINGNSSYVMPFYSNGSLESLLLSDTTPQLSTITLNSMALTLAKGLAFIHHKGFVHSDIKSPNLLVSDDYNSIVICDFGLTKTIDEAKHQKAAGTPSWAAPELFGQHGRNTPSSDIYSASLVLWQLFARQIPFNNLTRGLYELVDYITHGNRPKFAEQTPANYQLLIQQCWDQRADRRPSSQALVHRLTEIDSEAKNAHHL